jgi:hypothetical protein
VIYLLGALITGFFTLVTLEAGVWGAPTHPVQYVALFSSILLLASAFICLFSPVLGRRVAFVSISGIGALYIPGSSSLVPAASTSSSPLPYLLVIGYFALLGFALFYPNRMRWSTLLFACALIASSAFAAVTYVQRSEKGDIEWPSVVYFQWTGSPEPLSIRFVPDGWMTPEVQEMLSRNGITGSLSWSGATGAASNGRRVVVLCRSRITVPKNLYYPKHGTVIYLFDGTAWRSIPEQPDVYPAHATLNPDGMLEQDCPTGGRQGFSAFPGWQ